MVLRLEQVLLVLAMATMVSAASSASAGPATSPTTEPAGATQPVAITFFHSPTCEKCAKVKEALPGILGKYGDRVSCRWLNVLDSDGFNELAEYEGRYKVRVKVPPAIFIGRQCFQGPDEILSKLPGAIEAELAASLPTAGPGASPKGNAAIRQRFEQLSVPTVLGAGLLDGVNPCAFTTIVFLLSTLAYLGKSRRQLAIVGIGFTFAVFATYFVLGLGILTVLNQLQASSVGKGIPKILAYAVAILAFALAIWSLVDFLRYIRSKDVKAVTLGLPKSVKSRMHKIIREGLSTRGLLLGSLVVGFLVSILESICTGQVYAPIILTIQSVPSLRANAIVYLLLYNTMFILPLVAILIIAYKGVSSDRLGEFLRRHLAPLKLAMACLFVVLGVVLLMTV